MRNDHWRDLCRSLIGKPMPAPAGGDRLPRHVHKVPDVDPIDEPANAKTATTAATTKKTAPTVATPVPPPTKGNDRAPTR